MDKNVDRVQKSVSCQQKQKKVDVAQKNDFMSRKARWCYTEKNVLEKIKNKRWNLKFSIQTAGRQSLSKDNGP